MTQTLPAAQDETASGEFVEKHNATLNIGADKIRPGLAALVLEQKATQEQADDIWWYFAYCKENGFSLNRASTELGYENNTTMFRVFSCTYGAKLDNVCERIRRFKKLKAIRGNINDMPFVMTSVAQRIMDVCDAAFATQSIAMIWSDTQTGKTYALQEFARRNNHGTTKYVRMPSKAGIQIVAKCIAEACYVSKDSSYEGLRDRILKAINHTNLLIIDEVQEAFICYQKTSAIAVIEFIREIYDLTKCGVVLCMNNLGRENFSIGKLAPVLKQMEKRGPLKIRLPDKAPMSDFLMIAEKAFGLEKPESSALEIIKVLRDSYGIGPYCDYLKVGMRLAKNIGKPYSWDHFVRGYNTLVSLSEPEGHK